MIDRVQAVRRGIRKRVGRHERTGNALFGKAEDQQAGAPGLLLVQVDGLGFDQLQRATSSGLMPELGRLMESEPYVVSPTYAGVPSSTPAFQAELLYGCRTAVPAFGFVHRKTDRIFHMSDRTAASTIEAEFTGHGLLEGGSSYGNIYHGGASVSRFSMATLGWGDLLWSSRPRALPIVLLTHLGDLGRLLALSAYETVQGLPQLVRAIRSGEHWGTEVRFLQARVAVAVVLRELMTVLASIDVTRGLPVVHIDLLGYDEWAHRRGPDSGDAQRALRGIDRALGRMTRAARRSPQRQYDIWVFSDHGQEETLPYVTSHGRSVATAVGQVLRRHGIEHQDMPGPPRGIQGQRASMLGARVAEALVPGLEVMPRRRDPSRAVTVAQGPLGHIYLPHQVTSVALSAIASDLVADADVPLVLASDAAGGAFAWTSAGPLHLPGDAPAILGEDHPYLEAAAHDLIRVCEHRDAGEIVISGWRREGLPFSFPDENGSHAGPGPRETTAFLCAPADTPIEWSETITATTLRSAALDVLEGSMHRPSARWSRPPDQATMRLLTYNVHGCVGLDGTLSVERIARVIARYEPDVVALQEVDVRRSRSGGIDQAAAIAERLGMLIEFHPTFAIEDEQFGDAVLSRLPMEVMRRGPLPALPGRPDLEPRGVLWVDIELGGETFHVLNTHLSLHPSERRLQVAALMGPEWVGAVTPGASIVLCGDFNAGPGFPTCRTIAQTLDDAQVGLDGHRPRRTWGGRHPMARIDHIFLGRRLEAVHIDVPATHLTHTASDHLPLLADIRVRDIPGSATLRVNGRRRWFGA